MKVKHILVLFLVGFITVIIGATMKILHLPGANEIIMLSSALKVSAGILGIWKLMKMEKFRDFLNS